MRLIIIIVLFGYSVTKEGHTGVGRADLWIAGFEVHTNDDLMNWASSLAANREVLSKGQHLWSPKSLVLPFFGQ